MFLSFFQDLRDARVPVSLREFLTLLQAMRLGLAAYSVEDFYYLARACLVKDERNLDKFDLAFARSFQGLEAPTIELEQLLVTIPPDWLKSLTALLVTDDDKQAVDDTHSLDALLSDLLRRLRTQEGRRDGGEEGVGTVGTSPYGAYGYNPAGIRMGERASRHHGAAKVWDRRVFRNLDDATRLSPRTMNLALRRLRTFARAGAPTELDLAATIDATARHGGLLDIHLRPVRRNAVKVLLLLDVGGSMDEHTRLCAELFAAARAEFHHLEQFYFHNCPYDSLWRDNRRPDDRVATWDVLHTYPRDWKLVIVGDAAMAPFELLDRGGAVDHWNAEPGALWLDRLVTAFPHAVWLNPTPPARWPCAETVAVVRSALAGAMYPLTLQGLDAAMAALNR